MRILTLLISGMIGATLLTGPAHAAPVPTGKAALTHNPLYKTGEFDWTECKELDRRPDDLDSYKLYLDHLLECLDRSWGEEFKQAGLKFSKPKVRYITKSVATGCGKYPINYAAGLYCPVNKTMWVAISKWQLADPAEFTLFNVIAHEYGHYAQDRAGILPAAMRLQKKAPKAKQYAIQRQVELQAECFASAFIGSVWHSLGREEFDFQDLMDMTFGDVLHGKTKNIRYWMKRGWDGNGPKVCNTFTAPAARVS
ncbi:neutral zinc metallopeptidase [Acrocarpospora sp. B8E8]|uniref:neutral zinc metallopeptidase n=1 Tax=Acrocarpospora sp. B8E8 TaxID=3153572 RepID=UPI00325E62E4